MGSTASKADEEDMTMGGGGFPDLRANLPPLDPAASLEDKEVWATQQLMASHGETRKMDAAEESDGRKPPAIDNSAFENEYEQVVFPTDDDGYCVAVPFDDPEAIRAMWDEYGVVVVSGCLTPDECVRSEDDIWSFIERHCPAVRDDPLSWRSWPSLAKLGILGSNVILGPQMCENRQNPRIHQAFAAVFGTDRLWVNVGRASAMRPTVRVRWPRAELTDEELEEAEQCEDDDDFVYVDRPKWRTTTNWLHWDMNVFTGRSTTFSFNQETEAQHASNRGYDHIAVQGILAAKDCGPDDGGFHCVPAFNRFFRGWCNANKDLFEEHFWDNGSAGSIQVPKDDVMRQHVQPMPLRAGHLCIWSSTIPHGTFPNNSASGRMVQYIRMTPADWPYMRPVWSNEDALPEGFELTPLGRRLYGLDPWPPVDADGIIDGDAVDPFDTVEED